MQVIYVSCSCSSKKYSEDIEKSGIRVQQQSQKYNMLLMRGLVDVGADVDAVSVRPINRRVSKKFFYKSETDTENNIKYFYVMFANYPILRNVTVFLSTFFKILFFKTEKKRAIVCDALNIASCAAAMLAGKMRGIKTVGIVTDVPCHRPTGEKIPLYQRINLRLMKKFDGCLILTEAMNEIVNPRKKPFVVIEGHADINMKGVDNALENKYPAKVCLYAGTLRKIYGMEMLVEGFVKSGVRDAELHIYGDGNYADELKEIAKKHSNVKYFGTLPNDVVVREELKATLLINPRPTDAEYTKYSFPSKNMEYMASGTPILTTRLPGMPKEYEDYVYFIETETADGIAESIKNVLSLSPEELHRKGAAAKEFILTRKNNRVQAEKLLKMINAEVLDDV